MQSLAPEKSVQNQLFVHFGLRENPFGGTPDPRFLFHSETHREALASLINGIDCQFGFQVLVAQPGMGKTTLLFNFLERFRDTAHTAFLFQPQLQPYELLQSLLSELGSSSEDTSVRKLSEQINQFLGRAAQERKRVIVIVDEAQNLDFSVLETLRQLSNFETAQAKLMHIVLAGQPQLARNLAAPEQEQLRQRISTIGRLTPLTLNETRAYINHRLRTAGYRGNEMFTMPAVRNIWECGKGVPRNINTLCFNAMLLAFAGNTKSIDEAILDEASSDLDMSSVLADIYRMEPSLVASPANRNGRGKVQPIREADSGAIETLGLFKCAPSEASIATTAEAAELDKAVAPALDAKTEDEGENIPPALAEAIARISKTLEEHKILLATKSGPWTQAHPATPFSQDTLPANGSLAGGILESVKTPSPSKREEPMSAATKSPSVAAPMQPEKIGVHALAISASSVVASAGPSAKKTSAKRSFWPKAFALAAITGVLTFAIVEKSPWQHQAQASAEEPSQGPAEYSEMPQAQSSPGDSSFRSANRAALPVRNPDASQFDDVTVRKFPVAAGVAPEGAAGEQNHKIIFFDQDSAEIAVPYHLTLRQIADALQKDPAASAILEGHTDDSGPETYNLDLSGRRANAVRNALINEYQVPRAQLTAVGSGSSAPIQPNSSAAGRAYNRRVAVRFVHLGA